jgi:hypothetical protein
MDKDARNLDAALHGLDERKRSTLKRLIGTGAFIGPAVVSFTMADLTIDGFVYASGGNVTSTLPPSSTVPPTTQPPRGHPAKS